MIVDAHVHVWSDDVASYPWQPILAHVPPPTLHAPVERLLADMERAGVDRAVLVQPSVYGWDNRYLMTCLARDPRRFTGICLIDPLSTTPRQDLERWCGEGGCVGLRLNTIRQGPLDWLLGDRQRPLITALERLGLSLSFHMDIGQAPVVARLAERHPDLVIIIDYLGPTVHADPAAIHLVEQLALRPQIHVKLLCVAEDARTPYPFPDIAPFYRAVLERFGARRVMFGSDYPGACTVCPYEDTVAWVAGFPGLDEEGRGEVLGGTAARAFGLTNDAAVR
ncbi:amidohydrolase family protein [Ancylobacter terrae]|uniref:amidohydrolase family protein n=1 Tax=Ancylobacter sp. sgz301288 TaxID=3342077 RepID=UPI003858C8B2